MTAVQSQTQSLRRRRLQEIADAYTEEIHEPETRRQLAGTDPVGRYAAVTSEGSAESTYAANGNLVASATRRQLAERLAGEAAEGWLVHGRAWDLDGSWHSCGNLEARYRVELA